MKTDSPTVFYWDVTSQEVVTVDFLAAPPVEVTQGVTTDVVLKFNHLMHKLVVKLKATGTTITEKDLGEAKVSVSNFQSAAVIDLLKAKVQRASGTISQLEHTGIESIFIYPAANRDNSDKGGIERTLQNFPTFRMQGWLRFSDAIAKR